MSAFSEPKKSKLHGEKISCIQMLTEKNFLMHERKLKKIRADTRLLSGLLKSSIFDCRKVISFALTTLDDWLKKLAPLCHPISVFPPFLHSFAAMLCNMLIFR